MTDESRRVDAYLDTIARLEPDIAMVDRDAALASIAISLKRIADALESPAPPAERARIADMLWMIAERLGA
jgi:hypothetical protein